MSPCPFTQPSPAIRLQGGTYSKFVLYVLLLVYISNQWCRYLFNYLYVVADLYNTGTSTGAKMFLPVVSLKSCT